MIWTGFLLGLLGSWHCVAMCGPIALMVPGAKGKNRIFVIALYHTGKILAYMTLGSVFGMIPAFISSFDVQATITLSIGALMILIAFIPFVLNSIEKKGFVIFNRVFKFKNKMVNALDKNKIEYSFYIGFLNGFVPCGIVYFAALGAMSQPNFLDSILFMMFFGIGTIPLMSLFILVTGFFKTSFQKQAKNFRMAAFILTGIFMIWKGSSHLNNQLSPPKAGEAYQICAVSNLHN